MKNLKEKQNFKKGITLIALVVTIVVLLILASVSITVVFGDNGILQLAKEAGEKTNEAVKNDISSIGELEDILHETQTGIVVEKVKDANPGQLEESEGNIYTINSIEDLVFFSYDVTSETNNYEGKTVKLGLSLDFNSTKSYVDANRTDYGKYGYEGNLKTLLTTGEGFKPIGITTADDENKNFAGTFDGNGNFINGLYINIKIDRNNYNVMDKIGLFSKNYGTIQNLKLLNTNIYASEKVAYVAGICGQNTGNGRIHNCIVSGNIKGEVEIGQVGGIACYNSGTIEKCGNKSNIEANIERTNSESGFCGGICSSNGGYIEECYNTGNINLNSNIQLESVKFGVGGIAGRVNGRILKCYNIGSINANVLGNLYIGGILGIAENTSKISNCYNVGTVQGKGKELLIGAIVGKIDESCAVSSNYYSENSNDKGIGTNLAEEETVKMTEEKMKLPDFVTTLNKENKENTEEVWKQDTDGINKGFPVLKWQQQ